VGALRVHPRKHDAVHPVAALQTEYSLWTRDPEAALLPQLRELGIGFVPYSPLGHGFLSGEIRLPEQLSDDDWRKTNPRFTEENFQRNLWQGVPEVFSRFVATKLRVINHLKTFQQRHRGGKAVPLLFSSDLANITSQEFSISQTKNCGCVGSSPVVPCL
jgi:Aldo/keto reductase family